MGASTFKRPVYIEGDLAVGAYIIRKLGRDRLIDVVARANEPYQFIFDNSDNSCQSLAVEFTNTEFQLYDQDVQFLRRKIRTAKKVSGS